MNQNRNNKSKLITITVVSLIVIILFSALFIWKENQKNNSPQDQPNVSSDGEYINLNPPTEEEKQQVEDNKEELSNTKKSEDNLPKDQPANSSSSVTISRLDLYENNVEAAGYISGVYEDGGTCTYNFTKGNSKLQRQTEGFKDVGNTVCSAVNIPVSEFPEKGEWTLVLEYKSSTLSSNSQAMKIAL